MTDGICRWGILGTATIARKNWKAIRKAENATITAVASRDTARAQQFIDECQAEVPFAKAPEAVGSYEALLARDDVDAVYVPVPTAIRKQWVIAAAQAGKHVLGEKPSAATAEETVELLEACRSAGVQYMDGVMFMHSKRLPQIREVLDAGEVVGQVKRIATQFSFRAPDDFLQSNIRVHADLEPLGCLGDLGWYNLRFILWLMNWAVPQSVSGRMLSELQKEGSPHAVPMEFSGELFFEGDVSASFYCSFLTEHQQWAHVSGTKGFLQVPDFVLPSVGNEVAFQTTNANFLIQGCDFNMENYSRRYAVPEYSQGWVNSQETNMIRNFSDRVLSGRVESAWADQALLTQRVLDACLRSSRQDGQRVEMER